MGAVSVWNLSLFILYTDVDGKVGSDPAEMWNCSYYLKGGKGSLTLGWRKASQNKWGELNSTHKGRADRRRGGQHWTSVSISLSVPPAAGKAGWPGWPEARSWAAARTNRQMIAPVGPHICHSHVMGLCFFSDWSSAARVVRHVLISLCSGRLHIHICTALTALSWESTRWLWAHTFTIDVFLQQQDGLIPLLQPDLQGGYFPLLL